MIEMTIESVRINLATQQRVMILKAKDSSRYLFVWIAQAEAYAIAVHLQGTVSPRPLSHDFMKSLIEVTGASVVRVEISELVDEIFYARLVLDVAGKEVMVDGRPSDVVALAVRMDAPIYVAESVLEKAGVEVDNNKDTSPEETTEKQNEAENPEKAEETTLNLPASALNLITRENTRLKEQVGQLQIELQQAQERIKELENK